MELVSGILSPVGIENSLQEKTPDHSPLLRASGGKLKEINDDFSPDRRSSPIPIPGVTLRDSEEFPYVGNAFTAFVLAGQNDERFSPSSPSPLRTPVSSSFELAALLGLPVEDRVDKYPQEEIQEMFGAVNLATASQMNEPMYENDSSTEDCFRCEVIACPKKTNVVVSHLQPPEFFHANYVSIDEQHRVIATQYPQGEKGAAAIWEVLFNEGAVIVDLTNERDINLQEDYKPDSSQMYGEIEVQPIPNQSEAGFREMTKDHPLFSLRRFQMTKEHVSVEKDTIRFRGWEDQKGVNPDGLITLAKLIRWYMAQGGVPIIHCRIGVGRTGTVAVFLKAVALILEGKIEQGNLLEELKKIILECRLERGPGVVQNLAQCEVIVSACESLLLDKEKLSFQSFPS